MSKSISNIDWMNQLENVIREFVKEKLELIMKEEIFNSLSRNGRASIREKFNLGPMSWMSSLHLWIIQTVFEV